MLEKVWEVWKRNMGEMESRLNGWKEEKIYIYLKGDKLGEVACFLLLMEELTVMNGSYCLDMVWLSLEMLHSQELLYNVNIELSVCMIIPHCKVN